MDQDEPWLEFLHGDICGLCGNWGEIDTRGRATSPAGYEAGGLYWCICPNGRSLKEAGAKHGVRDFEPCPTCRGLGVIDESDPHREAPWTQERVCWRCKGDKGWPRDRPGR